MLANKSFFSVILHSHLSLLDFSLITWGNTYPTSLQPLITLQKKGVRVTNLSDFKSHSSPLFCKLGLHKLGIYIVIYLDSIALFIRNYYFNRLPGTFNNFFKSINKVHQYATRLASIRSLIIYQKLVQIMENLISVSVGLNSGMLLKKI